MSETLEQFLSRVREAFSESKEEGSIKEPDLFRFIYHKKTDDEDIYAVKGTLDSIIERKIEP